PLLHPSVPGPPPNPPALGAGDDPFPPPSPRPPPRPGAPPGALAAHAQPQRVCARYSLRMSHRTSGPPHPYVDYSSSVSSTRTRTVSPWIVGNVAMACSALRTLRSCASWVIITTATGAPWACPRPFCSTDSVLMAGAPR